MKKKIILVLIILIPSLIYFIFELSEANFTKMAFYGPKTVNEKGDTVYYTLPYEAMEFGSITETVEKDSAGNDMKILGYMPNKSIRAKSDAFVVIFVKAGEESKLNGLLEYEKYKKEKLNDLSIFIVKETPINSASTADVDKLLTANPGISLNNPDLDSDSFYSLNSYYFNGKPQHVFDYFAVLIDKDHHIRGYYDPTFISEMKRMIEEYKHLVLKDEHANMQNENKIEQNEN